MYGSITVIKHLFIASLSSYYFVKCAELNPAGIPVGSGDGWWAG
jgi:hypothetical protein